MDMSIGTICMIVIGVIVGYLCVYSLVDRIARCVEHCATEKYKCYAGNIISFPTEESEDESWDDDQR